MFSASLPLSHTICRVWRSRLTFRHTSFARDVGSGVRVRSRRGAWEGGGWGGGGERGRGVDVTLPGVTFSRVMVTSSEHKHRKGSTLDGVDVLIEY